MFFFFNSPRHLKYARPSFVEGMARVLDIGGTLNQYHVPDLEDFLEDIYAKRLAAPTGPEADAAAIREIWVEVGHHLYRAMGHFESQEQVQETSAEQDR